MLKNIIGDFQNLNNINDQKNNLFKEEKKHIHLIVNKSSWEKIQEIAYQRRTSANKLINELIDKLLIDLSE